MGELPNFIGMGAGRAGTTLLFEYLSAHPEVFIPAEKELDFFSEHKEIAEEDLVRYRAKFDTNKKVFGEISPSYLDPRARNKGILIEDVCHSMIQHLDNTTKLWFILRSPARRAFSQYLFDLKEATTDVPPDFHKEILKGERSEMGFVKSSFLAENLQVIAKCLADFPKLFLINEIDLDINSGRGAHKLCDFLGISKLPLDLRFKINSTLGVRYHIAQDQPLVVNLEGNNVSPHDANRTVSKKLDPYSVFIETGWYKWNKTLGPFDVATLKRFEEASKLLSDGLSREIEIEVNETVFMDDIKRTEDITETDLSCWVA